MLKKILKFQAIGLIFIGVNVHANSAINCEELSGCKKKICHLEKDLEVAKKMDNSSRVDGLQTSLQQVNEHCTDDKLAKDIEDKMDDAKEDLAEHTKDYEEAVKDNRADKIEKYKVKIAEDNLEINQLQKELKAL